MAWVLGTGTIAGPRILALGTAGQNCMIPDSSLLPTSWERPPAVHQYGNVLTVPPAAERLWATISRLHPGMAAGGALGVGVGSRWERQSSRNGGMIHQSELLQAKALAGLMFRIRGIRTEGWQSISWGTLRAGMGVGSPKKDGRPRSCNSCWGTTTPCMSLVGLLMPDSWGRKT